MHPQAYLVVSDLRLQHFVGEIELQVGFGLFQIGLGYRNGV